MLAPKHRAKASNGHMLVGVDGRSANARRFRDLVASYMNELGGDLGEADLSLVKQAAGMTLRAEQLQTQIVNGEPVNGDEIVRMSSECRRILHGLKAKAAAKRKPAAPSIDEIFSVGAISE